jgi:predicted RNA binding protein YcfA (HicA-like mRNA interferase family)
MDKISTTALSKLRSMPSKALFAQLENAGWIVRLEKNWELTPSGREQGGEVKQSDKFGSYIVWPPQLKVEGEAVVVAYEKDDLHSAANIGQKVELSARQVNALFSELGWVDRHHKGWQLTEQGRALGGVQKESQKTGIPYVLWPLAFIQHLAFQRSLKALKGDLGQALGLNESASEEVSAFRKKFPANFRAVDGHQLRSKAEVLIDNWLYLADIAHAYERRLPIEEDVYSTFYIPAGKIYVELWEHESDPEYQNINQQKLQAYSKYGLTLLELCESDIESLDDVMPRLLLKNGIEAY